MTHRLIALLAAALLALAACGDFDDAGGTTPPTTSSDPSALAGTNWVVISFGLDGADDPVIAGQVPTIRFGSDGTTVGGSTGCNTWFGAVTTSSGDGITFGDLGWTEMACLDDGVMEQEQRFAQALARIDRFTLTGENLVLEAADGSAVIRLLAPDPAPDLPLGGDWKLTTFIDGDVAMSLITGTTITLTIDPAAGTLGGHAGCNGYNGSLTATTGPGGRSATLAIGPVATTLMACEPDVMDQEGMYHEILSAATSMEVEDGQLTLSTDDGRSLVFEPAGA